MRTCIRVLTFRCLTLFPLAAALSFAQPAKPPAKAPAKTPPSAPAPDPDSIVVRDAGPLPSPMALTYAPLGEIHIPKPVIITLANGMKVYLLENHDLPIVRANALIRTGNLFDPKDKRGLATLTGITMRSGGTKLMTGDELDEKLEGLAASVEADIGESSGGAGFSCLSENTDVVLGWFRDVLTTPEFRQDKVDLAKTQIKSAISRRNDEAAGIASREILRIVYGRDTAYGDEETYATINAVTRDDIRAFYQRYFFPANIILAVYGDFQTADMQHKLENVFSTWTVTQEKVPPFPPVDAKPDPGVFLVAKEDVAQTFFEIGHLGGEFKSKDLPALSVAADVLGGGFSSRLFREVRSRLGYAYSISASWDASYDHPGIFLISGSTKSQTTEETIAAILKQVEGLRTAEITDQELKTAKDSALNSLVFAFERPASTLTRLVTYDYFGYPSDFLSQYQHGLEAVTKADVFRVAKEYFRADRFSIVAVGNQANFGTPLSELGLPVKALDVTTPSDQTAVEKVAGQQLLAKVLDQAGGASRFNAIQDFTQTQELQTLGSLKLRSTVQFIAPNGVREDQELQDGSHLIIFFDGKMGWSSSKDGIGELGIDTFPTIAANMSRQIIFILKGLSRNPGQATYIGHGVFELRDETGQPIDLTVDQKTGVILKLGFHQQSAVVEESFSDWHGVAGMKLPFRAEFTQNGKTAALRTIVSLKFNTHLNLEDLKKRP
jgi:zinc protease